MKTFRREINPLEQIHLPGQSLTRSLFQESDDFVASFLCYARNWLKLPDIHRLSLEYTEDPQRISRILHRAWGTERFIEKLISSWDFDFSAQIFAHFSFVVIGSEEPFSLFLRRILAIARSSHNKNRQRIAQDMLSPHPRGTRSLEPMRVSHFAAILFSILSTDTPANPDELALLHEWIDSVPSTRQGMPPYLRLISPTIETDNPLEFSWRLRKLSPEECALFAQEDIERWDQALKGVTKITSSTMPLFFKKFRRLAGAQRTQPSAPILPQEYIRPQLDYDDILRQTQEIIALLSTGTTARVALQSKLNALLADTNGRKRVALAEHLLSEAQRTLQASSR